MVGGVGAFGCGGGGNDKSNNPQCSDGIDNDGDGLVDFPDDPGCTSTEDDTENSLPSPQCSDGRDNDNDGKIDFPYDPGCLTPQQDTETDDCPNGPNCPQCANGKDDDGNGLTDYPNDPGCTSAADSDEFAGNLSACGNDSVAQPMPFDGHITGTIAPTAISHLSSTTCGGGGGEQVYQLRITKPTVVTATTDLPATNFDTVLYVRPIDCMNPTAELTCSDDFADATVMGASSLAISLPTPGLYFLVVDSHDAGAGGNFELQVDFLAGEGQPCTDNTGCGPTLVCRVPLGGTDLVCSKHVCSDGVDDDGDGKLDYPTDPGCDSPDDDDETDDCPSGPNCPECSDGVDNDHDGQTDYPNDTTCLAASDGSEVCASTDGVPRVTAVTTMGDTTNAHHDVTMACGNTSSVAPDRTYRLDVPALTSLTITINPDFDSVFELVGATCGGTPIGGVGTGCQDGTTITETNVAAGSYYLVVGGYGNSSLGTYTFTVNGKIANGSLCESPLLASGAVACGVGYACKGTSGSKTCQRAACSDGIDNDADGKTDYPFDPGCASANDDDETNPAVLPVCSNGTDDDTDGATDFPADYGCSSAAGTSEVFCSTETDATALITTKRTTSTTVGKTNDHTTSTCQSNTGGPDIVYGLSLPVPVASLQIDTNGSSFDTVLSLEDTSCATTVSCNDDGGSANNNSLMTVTNVPAGNYAVVVDGYSTNSGTVTLNVNGVVATGTACTAAAFTGANAYLKCPTGTTCTGGTCH